jgi:hypothetical protein
LIIQDKSSKDELDDMLPEERDRRILEQDEEDEIDLPTRLWEGWHNLFESGMEVEDVNPYGFQIRGTPSGSILKIIVFDLTVHFVKHLAKDQDKDGEWHFWFLDWHGSSANPRALLFLLQNRVFPVVLPSKTSIWFQPCDLGPNMRCSAHISEAAAQLALCQLDAYT